MLNQISKVDEFHKVFLNLEFPEKPSLISNEEAALRSKLMIEEVEEYEQACADGNLVEIADALGDQLYILCGTILKHGLQHKIVEVFNAIHESNMSKLGPDNKPILREDGKILKGDQYFPPTENIKIIIENE